jgi:hypothetical protein
MSHYSTHNTKLNDIDSIKDACNELGLTIKEGGTVRYYSSQGQVKADYVISWSGSPYDVGLVKDKITGNFNLVYDSYQGYVEKKLGKGCTKLIDSSTFHRIAKKAKLKGYFLTKKSDETGIDVTLTSYR